MAAVGWVREEGDGGVRGAQCGAQVQWDMGAERVRRGRGRAPPVANLDLLLSVSSLKVFPFVPEVAKLQGKGAWGARPAPCTRRRPPLPGPARGSLDFVPFLTLSLVSSPTTVCFLKSTSGRVTGACASQTPLLGLLPSSPVPVPVKASFPPGRATSRQLRVRLCASGPGGGAGLPSGGADRSRGPCFLMVQASWVQTYVHEGHGPGPAAPGPAGAPATHRAPHPGAPARPAEPGSPNAPLCGTSGVNTREHRTGQRSRGCFPRKAKPVWVWTGARAWTCVRKGSRTILADRAAGGPAEPRKATRPGMGPREDRGAR